MQPRTPSTNAENPAGATPFFSLSSSAAPLRNNYDGFVGTELTIGSTPLVVTQIGRYTAAGNSQTHIVKFVNADGSDCLADQSVCR